MGWQDRDYARPTGSYGAGGGPFRPNVLAGRSIVTILIAINVAIYVLSSLSPALGETVYVYGAMQTNAVLGGQIWHLVTSQYLHAGTWHLFVNMLVLHFLGRSLERMWSPQKFLIVYTLGGLAGNVFFTILGMQGVIDPSTPAVGASGCIYALLGIVAVLFPTATVYIYFLFPIKIRTAAYIFGAIALFSVISRGNNFGGEACHFAGLVFGVWWAIKGDVWWSRRQIHRSFAQPKVRAKKPGSFKAKIAERRQDAETIDRILRKVYDGGIHSLSDSEKRALQEATDRQQQRERAAGRIDQV